MNGAKFIEVIPVVGGPKATEILMSEKQCEIPEQLIRWRNTPQALAKRARVVLESVKGVNNIAISELFVIRSSAGCPLALALDYVTQSFAASNRRILKNWKMPLHNYFRINLAPEHRRPLPNNKYSKSW